MEQTVATEEELTAEGGPQSLSLPPAGHLGISIQHLSAGQWFSDPRMSQPAPDATPARLGMWDAVSIIVGIIIGASIYRSPADIYGNIPDNSPLPAWAVAMGLWALVGLLSFVGALCYAELATTYPSSGGDYTFIARAY